MSFLSSFGKRPPAKTQQVSRPAPVRETQATRTPQDAKPSSSAASNASGMRNRADFLREERIPQKRQQKSKKTSHLNPSIQSDRKRKSATPSTPQFDSDSEDGDGDSLDDILHAAKRLKPSEAGRVDSKRQLRDPSQWPEERPPEYVAIQGAALTSDKETRNFSSAFPAKERPLYAELQYPNSTQPERFELVVPKKADGYTPLRDIAETIEKILCNFLPEETSHGFLDDMTGIPRRLRGALKTGDADAYKNIIEEFNNVIVNARMTRQIQETLDSSHAVAFSLVERILDQVTVRTVSPNSEKLRQYESFSSNTYGELREEFNSQIFKDTEMDSSSVFIDLGSGVGNVVLQAALEVGCESYGIEMMPNPCEIAREQAKEFAARCRMWGIATGKVELLDGNFLDDVRLGPILARADVVLVNNELFSSDLNEKLRARFLDLKEGARIVSLKSFVPPGWRLTERTSEDPCGVLDVKKKEYWSGCVSWTNQGGTYFVSTKDSGRIERILKR